MASLQPATRSAQNPFESLPDELLLFIFKILSPFQRALILSTCRNWNQFILLNTQLWSTLTIPHGLPTDLVLTILRAFNSRSDFKLKQVVIETFIDNQEDLNLIFQELKKSAGTLKDLFIAQHQRLNRPTRKMAMQVLPMLEGLLTKYNVEELQEFTTYLSALRRKYDNRVPTFDKVDLRYYHTDTLYDIDEEDLEWLSKVLYLRPGSVEFTMSLYKLLQVASQMFELDLILTHVWDNSILDLPSSFERIRFKNLQDVSIPHSKAALSAFERLVEIDGKQTLVGGKQHSLISFKVNSLKSLHIFLYQDNTLTQKRSPDEGEVITMLLQQNPTVETLTLDCPDVSACHTGGQPHLNKVLEALISFEDLDKDQALETLTESEKVNDLCLPCLIKLNIRNATA